MHNPENLGLVSIYEAKSGKESSMDQELDICKRVNETATYNKMTPWTRSSIRILF